MQALQIATKTTRNIATELALISQNIAVSDIPNNEEVFAAKEASYSGGRPTGASILKYTNNVDSVVQSNIYLQISETEYHKVISEADTFLDSLMGAPGENNDLSAGLNDIFNNISQLSVNSSNLGLRNVLVEKISNYAEKLNSISAAIYQYRYNLDQKMSDQFSIVNKQLAAAQTYQKGLYASLPGSQQHLNTERMYRSTIEELSASFEVVSLVAREGQPQLSLSSGVTLLSASNKFAFKYKGAATIEDFILDVPLDPVMVSSFDASGKDNNQNIVIVSGGKDGERKSAFNKGMLGGIVEVRDNKLPRILKQLDSFAESLKNAMNVVHNQGVGYPPPNDLIGSRLHKREDMIGMQGTVRIAVLDEKGEAAPGVYSMLLDFDTLDAGAGIGKVHPQAIINEINYFFGNKMMNANYASLGNIHDIKLASMVKEILPNQDIKLDFDLHNIDTNNGNFKVNSATVTDDDGNVIPITIHQDNDFTVHAGINTRTGYKNGPYLSFNPGPNIKQPYEIKVNVTVTPSGGAPAVTDIITFELVNSNLDPIMGLLNRRLAPVALDNHLLQLPSLSMKPITASLELDNSGIQAADKNTPGQLKLSAGLQNWGIAIQNINSKDVGFPGNNKTPSGLDFSSHFGLNDLFVRKDSATQWHEMRNTAYFLTVRPDIKLNSDFLATGKLRNYIDYNYPTLPTHKYQVINGDFENGIAIFEIQNNKYNFISSDGVSTKSQFLLGYSSELIGSISLQAGVSESKYETTASTLETIQNYFMNTKGVNVNEQMTKMVQLINVQAAQGKIITIQQKFLDLLFNAIN